MSLEAGLPSPPPTASLRCLHYRKKPDPRRLRSAPRSVNCTRYGLAVREFHEPFGASRFELALRDLSILVRSIGLLEVDDVRRGICLCEKIPRGHSLGPYLRTLIRG